LCARQVHGQGSESVPAYVERELSASLACWILAHGFARARCPDCTAAHLVDAVIPRVPMRQWVLSLPKRLRPALRSHAALATQVLRRVER